jgi:flagellar motor switch protein FliM
MDPLLSQPEMEALREAMRDAPEKKAVRGLELCADDRLLRRALPEIDDAAAGATDAVRICLTRALRGAVQVQPVPAEIQLAEDARQIEERCGGRVVLIAEPGACDVPLLIDPQLVFLHVQREFGGSLDQTPPDRSELTGLERGMLLRLAPSLGEAFTRSFAGLDLRLRVRHVSARPCTTTLWPRQVSVITLTWRVSVGPVAGNVHLVLPPAVIEGLRSRLGGERPGLRVDRFRAELIDQLRLVEIEVVAELGKKTTSLPELLSLKVGDVLRLDRSLTEQVPVLVDGRTKLRGRPGTRGDTVTLTIEDIGESR